MLQTIFLVRAECKEDKSIYEKIIRLNHVLSGAL